MKISLPFDFPENERNLMRRAGYAPLVDPHTGIISYVKRLSRDFYPRFHVYIEEKDNALTINLHLDQKKPSYPGTHAHNADYDGPRVESEGERLAGLIKNQLDNQRQGSEVKNHQSGSRGFWGRLFSK